MNENWKIFISENPTPAWVNQINSIASIINIIITI